MRPFRFSLTFSILSSLACLLVLTWILLSLISFKTAEQDLLAQKNEEGRVLLAMFVSTIPIPLISLNEAAPADRFAARLARERDFAGLTVVDEGGRMTFAISDRRGADARMVETLKTGSESFVFSRSSLTVTRYTPIRSGDRVVGACRLTLSLAGEYERLKRSRHIFFAYFVLDFLLLLGLGSYLLSRIVVVPIKRLLKATERITAGDYSHAVNVPGSAEVADLAESFGFMQLALRSKREEVETYVKSLERANSQLQVAREESVRAEKMASVGLLAAGMAHEIGAPLSAIIGYAGIMRDELTGDPVKGDYLRRIEDEACRIDQLIRGLLDYARPSAAQFEDVEIGALVGDTLALFADREAFKTIESSLKIEEGLPLVHVDRRQLQQVLINLFLNARDAMPQGGRLDISAGRAEFSVNGGGAPAGAPIVVMGRRKDDFHGAFSHALTERGKSVPCIKLEVRDTGEGILPENLAKVFDPFFTTKEPGKGTGLGLAISARIIDSFNGRITVKSALGNGTVFALWLPIAGSGTGMVKSA